MRTERELKFKNIRNIRDFRGLVTEDGKVLKSGRIIRSGHLGSASEKEIEKLKSEYELKKVIDLRTDLEKSEKPDPQTSGLQIISNPVFSASVLGITHENINDKEAVLKVLPEMADLYRTMVTNEDCVKSIRDIVQMIVNNRDGAILWHCTEGKDRCGVISAIILSILGIDRKTILDDYMLTNKIAMKKGTRYYWLVVLGYHSVTKAKRVKSMYVASLEYIESALNAIDELFGSMADYIKNQLGITDEMKQSFKEYMTE